MRVVAGIAQIHSTPSRRSMALWHRRLPQSIGIVEVDKVGIQSVHVAPFSRFTRHDLWRWRTFQHQAISTSDESSRPRSA